MTTVSATQSSALSASATYLQAQATLLPKAAQDPAATQTTPKADDITALSFPPVAGSTPPVPPGRFENPGRQRGVLEFGPSPNTSALTRTYTSTGQLVPPPESAVNLFAQPVRGINYLA